MKVALRKKALTGGRSSLYLDFYPALLHPDTGKLTRREFLGLHLYDKAKDEMERRHNKETIRLAEHTRATRQIEIQNHQFGFLSEEKRKGSFIDFFKATAAKRIGSNSDNWYMGLRYFADYAGPDLRFIDLNVVFCEEYRAYLLSGPALGQRQKRIAVNTAVSYFNKFKAVLKAAYKAGLLSQNINDLVDPIKDEETHREFLTIEEFQKLAQTKVKNELLKRAALFSGLTGLRFSDVHALTWSHVRGTPDNYYIQFKQEKTAGAEVLPISDTAYSLLGERRAGNFKVFEGMKYAQVKTFLVTWMAEAGVRKNITFHSFRHTYATLQLTSGTDIFTISKLLGHKNVKTTQIYTKVIDSKKKEAANRIKITLY